MSKKRREIRRLRELLDRARYGLHRLAVDREMAGCGYMSNTDDPEGNARRAWARYYLDTTDPAAEADASHDRADTGSGNIWWKCSACGIERTDHSGLPGEHLPTCPNCGSEDDPLRERAHV